jgi:hypothetical protein
MLTTRKQNLGLPCIVGNRDLPYGGREVGKSVPQTVDNNLDLRTGEAIAFPDHLFRAMAGVVRSKPSPAPNFSFGHRAQNAAE